VYSDFDFSNLALMIYKKSAFKVDILINNIPMEDAHKFQIKNYNDTLEFVFKDKNQGFLFKLEEYFLDFILNSDYVYEK
jgi:hypothetical protein